MSTERLLAEIDRLPLVDHHVHGALRHDADRSALEQMLTESDRPIPPWMTQFDSQIGFAVRRWCAPVLGLAPHADPETYVARRTELGTDEVNRRLLDASGVGHYLLETGYKGEDILDPQGMAAASGRPVDEVVRLETVLEDVARTGVTAAELPDRFRETLAARSATAVGLKSIVAYRHGFDFDPGRPDDHEVSAAAGAWLAECAATGTVRVSHPVLLRFALWCGVDRGLPIQLHAGYGDPDVELHRCDPLLLTRFLKNVEPYGTDLLLLHCYPFQRNAGYLAQVFPHVYFDVGLGINYTGMRSDTVIAESLELAPFAKILFSSDAWGPPELHHLGALLWRRGMARTLGAWTDSGEWDLDEALKVVRMIGHDNARRVYRLEDPA
ncbi:amidohydrolase family protein [Streptomyces sioyaensis]|uniref:Amidohydrolase n=1 Tax=Streptomyces sioyaensis TaxID=67364 RepID=A0A4V1NPK9_9ACTN|nr:amidohydrolase family protein [Streptomyces sioyaensis]MBM4791299.1 amidohydrolase family protein [Streptomyces sioyaensis]RXS65180.1 amidohydrolase [Streptomyces sioyaensis]